MARVEFNDVTKRYDENTVALQHLSLDIEDGEFVVLVGPSGCGKSTALRLLAGLDTVSEGEILIDNEVVNQTTPQQRNVAMVFQNYALYPHMSVRGNLEFPLKMARTPPQLIKQKLEQITGMLDLADLLERKPKQLSGGQRQRVAMGRALVRDPSVFLLDEPLSNLDARLRAQIRADIAHIQRRLGKTTLYVTHDQVEAMTLGDRVAVMHEGKLQQVGTPESLYTDPQNTFVARFVGSPGMNILPSKLINEGDDGFAVMIGAQTITLSQTAWKTGREITQYVDQAVFVGIRPEALHARQVNSEVPVNIKIVSVEFLGHESLVYFKLPGSGEHSADDVLIARIPGQFHSANNSDVVFFIDPAAVYLYTRDGQVIRKDGCNQTP